MSVCQARVRARGGVVAFTDLVGRAEIWLDGHKVAEKADPAPAALEVPIPAGEGPRRLVVLVRAESGKASGFARLVAVREDSRR